MAGHESHLVTARFREYVQLAGAEASDPEIVRPLRHARIWDWVSGLSGGLGTLVGERGHELSGGRRPAAADRPSPGDARGGAVLDESTAHPDPGTARELIAYVFAAARDQSLLLITHRTEGLELVDRVVSPAPPGTPNSLCHVSTG